MKIPVYLKSNTENSAVIVSMIDITPHEWTCPGTIQRTYRRNLSSHSLDFSRPCEAAHPVYKVNLTLKAGPYGIPYATHCVPISKYSEAETMWRALATVEAAKESS